MKISERQANFLKALHAAFADNEFTTRKVCTRLTGLALKEPANTALLQAVVGCVGRNVYNARVGRLLEKVRARRHGDLELLCDGEKCGGYWRYYVKDHSLPPIPMPDMTPKVIEVTSFKQWDQLTKEQDKLREQFAREDDRVKAAHIREEDREADKKAKADQAARDLEGDPTVIFTSRYEPIGDARAKVLLITRPQAGVEASLHGDLTGRSCSIKILLRGDWPQRKQRYEQLVALFHRKGWCSPHESPFNGDISPALIRGKEIPSWASQDPAHYNTARTQEQTATRLAMAGYSSNDITLEEYIMQQRRFAWGVGVGGSFHRPPGMHSDSRSAIPLKRFDPLQRPNEPERSC